LLEDLERQLKALRRECACAPEAGECAPPALALGVPIDGARTVAVPPQETGAALVYTAKPTSGTASCNDSEVVRAAWLE